MSISVCPVRLDVAYEVQQMLWEFKRPELQPHPWGRKVVTLSGEGIAGRGAWAEAEGGGQAPMWPGDRGGRAVWWRKRVSTRVVRGCGAERAGEFFITVAHVWWVLTGGPSACSSASCRRFEWGVRRGRSGAWSPHPCPRLGVPGEWRPAGRAAVAQD